MRNEPVDNDFHPESGSISDSEQRNRNGFENREPVNRRSRATKD